MAIKKISNEEAMKLEGTTNWDEVDALTEEDIAEAVKLDKDSSLLTDEELKQFESVQKKY
jgi:hypothetical protein